MSDDKTFLDFLLISHQKLRYFFRITQDHSELFLKCNYLFLFVIIILYRLFSAGLLNRRIRHQLRCQQTKKYTFYSWIIRWIIMVVFKVYNVTFFLDHSEKHILFNIILRFNFQLSFIYFNKLSLGLKIQTY